MKKPTYNELIKDLSGAEPQSLLFVQTGVGRVVVAVGSVTTGAPYVVFIAENKRGATARFDTLEAALDFIEIRP